jgi:hypothetical protein
MKITSYNSFISFTIFAHSLVSFANAIERIGFEHFHVVDAAPEDADE